MQISIEITFSLSELKAAIAHLVREPKHSIFCQEYWLKDSHQQRYTALRSPRLRKRGNDAAIT